MQCGAKYKRVSNSQMERDERRTREWKDKTNIYTEETCNLEHGITSQIAYVE